MKWLNFEDNKLRLTIIAILILSILKFVFSNNYTAIFSNIFVDAVFLYLIYLITHISKWEKFNKISFYILFVINFLIFSFNSIFLNDSIVMKYSLSNFDISAILFLFKSIIPWEYFIVLPIIVGLLIYLSFEKFKYEKYLLWFVYFLICLSFIFMIFNISSVSNIYTNTFMETADALEHNNLELNEEIMNSKEYDFSHFDKELNEYSSYSFPNKKRILIFVMEQTSYDTFWNELNNSPKERNFFSKVKNNTHVYTNYYTNNQDSRTTIWTMFNSQFLPFECYIDNWNKVYGFVLGKRNLVDLFNYHNYETHVASSVSQPGLLIGAYDWKELTFIQDYDVNNKDFLCIHSLEYQEGCEDLIILDDVKEALKKDKLFFLQEFIYGHGVEYENTKGMTRTEYYNEYLFQLYEFLEEENLVEDTLIMIVADHGEKGYQDKQLWNYKLPLFVVSSDLKYSEIDELYFHIDFKDILLHYLIGEKLEENEGNLIVGQTQSGEFAYVGQNKSFLANYFGKNIKLRSSINMVEKNSYETVLNEIYLWKKYQEYVEELSLADDYHCEYCLQNIENSKK